MTSEKATSKDKKKSLISRAMAVFRNLLAFLFWIFIVFKLFIFDLDTFLIQNYFPQNGWLIQYKFFILIGLTTLVWILSKGHKFIEMFLFIIFYPFILFFWQIPVLIFKSRSWTVGISFVNTVISFFTSFKYNFFVFSISAISFCLLFKFTSPILTYVLILILLVILIVIYIHRFLTIFMSSSMYKIHLKFVNFLIKNTKKITSLDDEIRSLPVTEMNSTQLAKWTNNLQFAIILNRGCYFLSSKLQEYQKSNLNIVFYLLNLFVLLILTVFFLASLNFALFRIHPEAFVVVHTPNLFGFVYYSFNTTFFSTIPEIIASSGEAHFLRMIQIVFSFLLISIFTVLIFNIKSKKHVDELGKIITELNYQGDQIDSRINSEYKLSVNDAIIELERLKSGLIKFIYFLSENLGRRN
jgi:hypothetical protein